LLHPTLLKYTGLVPITGISRSAHKHIQIQNNELKINKYYIVWNTINSDDNSKIWGYMIYTIIVIKLMVRCIYDIIQTHTRKFKLHKNT